MISLSTLYKRYITYDTVDNIPEYNPCKYAHGMSITLTEYRLEDEILKLLAYYGKFLSQNDFIIDVTYTVYNV